MLSEQQKTPDTAPYKVLVVEDSADDRELYRRLLSKDFQMEEAGSVEEGLGKALQNDVDCIVVDHELPDGNGIKFIEELRSQKPDGGPALVVVTGRGSETTAAQAMKAGALDYMPKSSVTAGSMSRCIRNAVAKNRLQHETAAYQGKLEKSCRALSEFAHTASHDIKAPLRHIISYCEMLRDDFGDKLGEAGGKYTSRLIINAKRLQRLVDDLLAYSESRETAEDKTELDFNLAIKEVLEMLEENVRDAEATVNVPGQLPTLPVYPLRIKRLWQNLIGNALKYRGTEKPVVTISFTEEDGEYIFCVNDNGCGIAPEYRDQIFEPFKRLHSRDEVEGSGLGLAICRDIVAAHGGRIWVESEVGQGSTFCFSLPKA